MALRHWRPGKLVIVWLVVVAWDALILTVVFSVSPPSDPPGWLTLLDFVFVFSGPVVSVVAFVLTWKWFTARRKRD